MKIPDPALPFVDAPIPQNPERRNLREDTERWLAENPNVYAMFERTALRWHYKGKPFGIGLLTERIRWEVEIETGRDDFKINNNHRAYIARKLVADHPEMMKTLRFRKTRY